MVTKVSVRQQRRSPAPPFTTSTLQQEASRKLGFSPKRTMSVAQRLYEGIEVDGEHVGLTTYMRTDSTAMAGVAMGEAREVIAARFGDEYTMPKGRVYKTKSKGAQEAHEAIRPTSFQRDPDSAGPLARLRGAAAVSAHLAARARLPDDREAPRDSPPWTSRPTATACAARASKVLFDGFSRVYTEGRDDVADDEDDEGRQGLPALAEGQVTDVTTSRPRSTSPSRRRASPRRPSSRHSRSTASAGPAPTPRPSRPSSTAATWS